MGSAVIGVSRETSSDSTVYRLKWMSLHAAELRRATAQEPRHWAALDPAARASAAAPDQSRGDGERAADHVAREPCQRAEVGKGRRTRSRRGSGVNTFRRSRDRCLVDSRRRGVVCRLSSSGTVDHPLEEDAHGDTAARSLGLDPSTPVVVEADANNGGLGRRHDPLTVTPGVYRFGAEWWQPGCERRGPADGSERLWSRATAALREVGEVTETAAVAHVCALRRRRVESGDDGGRPGSASVRARPRAAGRLGELTERWRRSSCD